MKLTVIVSSYNRPALLVDALQSIRDQRGPKDYPLGTDVQILVADDFSEGEVQDVCFRYQAHVIRPAYQPSRYDRQFGMRCSDCINAVLPYVAGDFIAFLPDDDWLPVGSLWARASYLHEHPDAHCVYGRLEACKPRTGVPHPGRHQMPDDAASGTIAGYPDCQHDRNGFWQAGPLARAANVLDHGMVMVRNSTSLPQWPLRRTAGLDAPLREVLATEIPADAKTVGVFDAPDAGWFFRLEMAGLGPFYGVPEVAIVKRYHQFAHRTDPSRRE